MSSRRVKSVDCHSEVSEPTVAVATATSRVGATTDINQVAAATSLISTLRSRSSETDALARLPDATIADLEKAHLFDMLVPKVYGGRQCSLRTFMDVVVELGRGDGSAAWVVALLSANTWMAATLYPKLVVDEIFSGESFRTAGVLAPRKVKTKRVDGGILIEEGSWNFNSGVYHAQWDILGIPIFDESGQFVDTGSALIPTSEERLSISSAASILADASPACRCVIAASSCFSYQVYAMPRCGAFSKNSSRAAFAIPKAGNTRLVAKKGINASRYSGSSRRCVEA